MIPEFPNYAIFREFSRSGRYIIYQAMRESDKTPVLLKVLASDHPTLEDISTLKNEMEVSKDLKEKTITSPISLDKHLSQFFLVLEDKGFEPLSRLEKAQAFNLKQKLKLAVNLAEALWSIQKHRITHKNLQPENILVDKKSLETQITGFTGASKLLRQKIGPKNPAQIAENLDYISPEQTGRMNRDIDYRTDYYSLGIILYELFTDRLPFKAGDTMERIHAHLALEPTAPHKVQSEIPVPVSEIILKLLSKGAEERYSSTLSLIKDLQRCLDEYEKTGKVEPFELAQSDVSSSLQISQKLYGRELEIKWLSELIGKISNSPPHLCLIGGYSGIGKSALVLEMQKPVIEEGGVFIRGKYDQFKSNIPYSAFIQALQELIQHILTESDDKIDYWKHKIQQSLGKNAAVITDVIPELKLIIEEPEEVPQLDTEQTYNRFSLLFQQFITTFCSPETPLLLFLDDLQWIDSASQKLIEMLLLSHQTRGLLIVGAFRSNETDRYHPLRVLSRTIEETSPNRLSELEVGPLWVEPIQELLADTLGQSPEKTLPLAEIIFNKTQGNPFFINQILSYLYDEKLLSFSPEKGEWIWDIEEVKNAKVSDNIVSLLLSKLQKTSRTTQEILMLAACTGHSFDISLLSHLSDYSPSVLVKHLREAHIDGFITTDGHIAEFYWESTKELEKTLTSKGNLETLKFPHDRVQQAVYSLIPPEKRKAEHLKIGRILSKSIPPSELEDKIFDIVYQINQAEDLVKDKEERILYARYNLIAGKKAMNSVAYRTAIDYLKMGLLFLPDDKWQSFYDLAFELEVHLAESAFFMGDFDEAERLFSHALKVAKTHKEKIQLYTQNIKLLISTTKYTEAIENGRQALKLLDVDLPKNVSKLTILKEFLLIKLKLFRKDPLEFLETPEISDPQQKEITALFFVLVAPAYLSAKELYAYIILRGLRYCLEWGHTPFTAYFIGGYGVLQNIIFKDVINMKWCGQLALELCHRSGSQEAIPATKFLVGTFITPYYNHLKESIKVLKSSFDIGIVIGDLMFGVYSLAQLMANQFISATNLSEMEKILLDDMDFVSKVKAHNRGFMFFGAEQTIKALTGRTEAPWSMDSEHFSEKAFFQKLVDGNYPLSLYFVYVYKMQLCFLFERYDVAIETGIKCAEINYSVRGHPINTEREYYYALSVLQREQYPTRQEIKEIKGILKQLKTFARVCPANFECKYRLILAELNRVLGKKEAATENYDRAIEAAKESDFTQFAGIGNELFAKFWLSLNKTSLAKQYLIEAHYNYYRWGASEKVKQLEEKYPHLLRDISHANGLTHDKSGKGHAVPIQAIDLDALVKASQVISGQLDLDILIEDMIKILTENAGAQKAILIMEDDGKWMLKAKGEKMGFEKLDNILLDKAENLSSSVIYYVIRTKESLVLNNACEEGLFTNDPYIMKTRAKSIMAVPLMHQGKVTGVIWLENSLAEGAFTESQVEIVRLLSAQIANAIENARLFKQQSNLSKELQVSNTKLEDYSQNLEKKVYLRTSELKEKNEQLQDTLAQIKKMQAKMVEQEKLVSLGAITKSIASEVREPLGYIYNFSQMTEELLKDLHKAPDDPKLHEQIDINLKKIDEHAKKADEIITRMIEESRSTDLVREPTDINQLIRDYADLVYYNYYKKDPLFVLSLETDWDEKIGKIPLVAKNIGRVIYNLIDNSCYSTDQKKKEAPEDYTPTITLTTKRINSHVEIKIRDNGQGIPPDTLDKLFTPYLSTKSDDGAGMGLALSYDIIVKEHQGSINIKSEEGKWTEATLILPVGIPVKH
ncbi:MAG: AAA family ATPase [Chlamydiia bacterium]|nr:AAA family ATPase [Chlamydiia bacterium]